MVSPAESPSPGTREATAASDSSTGSRAPEGPAGGPGFGSLEGFLLGDSAVGEIARLAAMCPTGAPQPDADTKVRILRDKVWGQAKSAIQRHAGADDALTQQEINTVAAEGRALKATAAAQEDDLADFQSQLPVVTEAYSHGNRWKSAAYLATMLFASMVFAAVLIPTLQMLAFLDPDTGEPVSAAVWKAGVVGLIIGLVLAGSSWLAAGLSKDINPHNNTAEAIWRLSPLLVGLAIAAGVAMLRAHQTGFSWAIAGLTIIEFAIVCMIELLAHRHAYRYADSPASLAAKVGDLLRNIQQTHFRIAATEEGRARLGVQLAYQREAKNLWNAIETGREAEVRARFDAWTEELFELNRPASSGRETR